MLGKTKEYKLMSVGAISFNHIPEYAHSAAKPSATDVPKVAPQKQATEISRAIKEGTYNPHDYPISRPILEAPRRTEGKKTTHALIADLIDSCEKTIRESQQSSQLRIEVLGTCQDQNSENLNIIAKKQIDLSEQNKSWDKKLSIANTLLHAITAASGAGLLFAGEPYSGTSLLISGSGGLISAALKSFEGFQGIAQGIEVSSALVGALGGIAGAFYNPSAAFSSVANTLSVATGFVSNAANGFVSYNKYASQAKSTNFERQSDALLEKKRLLDGKYKSALTSHKSTVSPLSKTLKALVQAQNRITSSMERIVRYV